MLHLVPLSARFCFCRRTSGERTHGPHFSILPFTAALVIALAAMPQHVYAFNQRGLGVDHAASLDSASARWPP
jgi:hypothetical protein